MNPPPPLGGRSVPNRNSRTDRLQSLSRVRTLCRASPKIPIGRPSGLKFPILFRFLVHFFLSQKTSKFRLRPKRPKISKIGSRIVFGSDFGRFWDPFWHQFSLYFTNRRKRLFCYKYQAKRLFLPPKPSHFGTQFQSKFHVFSGLVFGHPFSVIFPR